MALLSTFRLVLIFTLACASLNAVVLAEVGDSPQAAASDQQLEGGLELAGGRQITPGGKPIVLKLLRKIPVN